MKTIIVTAADEAFAPLLQGLIQSLHQWDTPLSDAIGVLDLGLSKSTLEQIQTQVTDVVIPECDFPIDDLLGGVKSEVLAVLPKYLKAFLPKYFPGYDVYLWLDSDTWVQERFAVDWFLNAAKQGLMAIVPEAHGSYVQRPAVVRWREERLHSYYGENAVRLLEQNPYFNAGAFALRSDAPHWDVWAKTFIRGLEAAPSVVSDQTALNYAIWKESLPVHALSAFCNWCCHLATPVVNLETRKLCDPADPRQPIGLVHMTASEKKSYLKIHLKEKVVEAHLHYGGLQSL